MHAQPDDETPFRAILGLAVLLVAVTCANVGSLPIDTAPFVLRLEDASIRELFIAGFVLSSAPAPGSRCHCCFDCAPGDAARAVQLADVALPLSHAGTDADPGSDRGGFAARRCHARGHDRLGSRPVAAGAHRLAWRHPLRGCRPGSAATHSRCSCFSTPPSARSRCSATSPFRSPSPTPRSR